MEKPLANVMDRPRLPVSGPPGFRIIAHRGAAAYAPENTMAAFRRAREMGAGHARLAELRGHSVKGVADTMRAIETGCDGLTLDWPDWLVPGGAREA